MRKAIVCGSGVAGLSAAIALGLRGWAVSVYERSSTVREIGAGIFIKGNGLRVLEGFGLLDRIRRDCVVLRAARTPLSGAIRVLVPRSSHETENIVREFWSGRLRVGVSPCTATEVFSYLIAPLNDQRGARTPIEMEYWAARFPRLAAEGLFQRA